MEASKLMQCMITDKQSKQINTLKDAWLTVRAKENIKLGHCGPSQRPASDTNQRMKTLRQGRHWVSGLTHNRAIK